MNTEMFLVRCFEFNWQLALICLERLNLYIFFFVWLVTICDVIKCVAVVLPRRRRCDSLSIECITITIHRFVIDFNFFSFHFCLFSSYLFASSLFILIGWCVIAHNSANNWSFFKLRLALWVWRQGTYEINTFRKC